jgi:heme/copper-type cytochrome/quinol oxidase subunit 3
VNATLPSAERTALLGMVVFLAAWAVLFAALFFAYGALRVRAPLWPPADLPHLPLGLPALGTVLLGASSALLWRNDRRAGRVALATLLGAGFLAIQFQVWGRMIDAGMLPSYGPYPSVFFGLTVFHALHVAVGIAALGGLAGGAALGRRPVSALSLRLWTIYWHMVGAVWLVMFLAVYVL